MGRDSGPYDDKGDVAMRECPIEEAQSTTRSMDVDCLSREL